MTTVDEVGAVGSASTDPFDARLARRATGLLREFNQAGVLSAADVHVASTLGRLGHEDDEAVLLALALAVRGVRFGSVCVVLRDIAGTVSLDDDLAADSAPDPAAESAPESAPDPGVHTLNWPVPEQWLAACSSSPLVSVGDAIDPADRQGRPLRLLDDLLYLDRYWRQEQVVRAEMDRRAVPSTVPVDVAALSQSLGRLFPAAGPDRQRLAAAMTVLRQVSVVAGGPGTGKTTTVARLLALLRSLPGDPPRVALAAPTGKAAARLQEAVSFESTTAGLDLGHVHASTLHRLLGWRPESRSRFRHDSSNRLPYDVVVVDESSMVSLTLMSRLLEALRPDARLVLVGDPDQLASVEAGAVLGDLVARPAPDGQRAPVLLSSLVADDLGPDGLDSDDLRNGVVRLTRTFRFGSSIGALARAVHDDDADEVLRLLRSGGTDISFLESTDGATPTAGDVAALRDDVVSAGRELARAAVAFDVGTALAALERHQLLCAHRSGPSGVARWTAEMERWLAVELDADTAGDEWYVGRPLVATANDYEVRLFNGDTGVVVLGDDGPVAAFRRGAEPVLISPNRLSGVQTRRATTVHRAQGSQFERVSILLPPVESPLLTRELFYTAVTRAMGHVRVIGSEAAIRRAVSRPIMRASGLRRPSGQFHSQEQSRSS